MGGRAGGGASGGMGSASRNGGFNSAERSTLSSVESRFKGYNTEHGAIIDDKGNIIEEKNGGKHSVKMTKSAKDAIFTHNHPGKFGSTFSWDDVAYGVSNNAKGIRVVIKATGQTHTITRPKGGWGVTASDVRNKYYSLTGDNTTRITTMAKDFGWKFQIN